jgi:uncharacterized membrane protein required for colicin V production
MFVYIDVQHFAVAHRFSFLCFVFCFVCLCPVSYVLTVAAFSGLSILDFHFGFAMHAALRRKNRNQDNVSEWGDMSIRGLLFQ